MKTNISSSGTLVPLLTRVTAILAVLCVFSCEKPSGQDPTAGFNVSGIVLPSSIDCTAGEAVTLQVVGKHGPETTDKVEFAGAQSFVLPILQAESDNFSFVLPAEVYSGDYVFSVIRGEQTRKVGRTRLMITSSEVIDPQEATVYGKVSALGKGVEGVVVSDGYEVTATDENGIYRLNSQKKHGYVFISLPSGYEALSDGVLPIIHSQLTQPASVPERSDFALVPVEGQDNATLLMMGDIHLARRSNTNDRNQFADFVTDINAFAAGVPGPVYGVTLGDMTWDLYWIVNSYGYSDYLRDMNNVKGLQIFHTIGNHDHSMYYSGDFNTVKEYKQKMAPTYYSFNIGKFHCVVLDDVECTNSTRTTDDKGNPCYVREYNGKVVSDEIAWLQKDLSYVDAATPLLVMMHIHVQEEDGSGRLPSSNVTALVDLLKSHPQTHIFTGHTHRLYNHDKLAESEKYYEHNSGAVCGTWWWSGFETPGVHIGQDGTPGGYQVVSLNGTDISWQYKATGSPLDYQFRAYDRNGIHITADKYVPSGNATSKAALTKLLSDTKCCWATASAANEVYINVWNWDPSWTVEVLEGDTPLTVTRVTELDPLHLIAYTAKRLNKSAEAGFATVDTRHLFRATATAPDSELTIRVTDRFGHVYQQTMKRPMAFSTETYEK